jgi:hypothetical protein
MEDIWKKIKELEERCDKLERELAKKKQSKLSPSGVSEIKKAFCDGYKAKFGHEYSWGARENGQAAQFLRTYAKDRAIWLIQWFIRWQDPFITKQGHPFGLLVSNVVKLEAVLSRGGRYYQAVVESRMRDEKIQDDLEVMTNVNRRSEENGNSKIGFDSLRQLQDEANTRVQSKRNSIT